MIKKLFLCVCGLLLSSSMLLAQKTVTGTRSPRRARGTPRPRRGLVGSHKRLQRQ